MVRCCEELLRRRNGGAMIMGANMMTNYGGAGGSIGV